MDAWPFKEGHKSAFDVAQRANDVIPITLINIYHSRMHHFMHATCFMIYMKIIRINKNKIYNEHMIISI